MRESRTDKVVGLDVANPENYGLYKELQDELRTQIKSDLVKSISIQ